MTREEGAALTQRGDAKTGRAAKAYTDKQVGTEREQRIAADAKKRKDKKDMIGGIIGGAIGTLFVLLVGGLLFRQQIVATMARSAAAPPAAPATPPVAPLNDAQRDATHVGAVRGAGFVPNWRQVGRREGVLVEPLANGGVFVETFEAEGDGRERFVSPDPDAGGNAVALAISGVPTDGEVKETTKSLTKPEPPMSLDEDLARLRQRVAEQAATIDALEERIKQGAHGGLAVVVDDAVADAEPKKKEGTVAKLARRVSRRKTKAEEAAIADTKKSAEEPTEKESAEAKEV